MGSQHLMRLDTLQIELTTAITFGEEPQYLLVTIVIRLLILFAKLVDFYKDFSDLDVQQRITIS